MITLLCCAACHLAWSQPIPPIYGDETNPGLRNPSFEDIPRHSMTPDGWIDCGFPNESQPDVQPSGAWEVYRPAVHGYTYLGMVTRENDTWESVGQKLSHPLLGGRCYQFSIYLCSSSEYWSAVIPDSLKDVELEEGELPLKNFDQAIKLRIWGGDGYCNKQELLAESSTISNHEWRRFQWKVEPNRDITHIVLEAFYKTPTLFPYNGNILVDNASIFKMVSCNEEEELILPPTVRILQPIEKVNNRYRRIKVNATVRNIKSKSQVIFKVNDTKISNFDFDFDTGLFSTTTTVKQGKNSISVEATNKEGTAYDETQVYWYEKEQKQEPEVAPPPPADVVETPPAGKKEFKILKELNETEVKEGQIIELDRLYFKADSASISSRASLEVLEEIYQYLADNPTINIEVGGHTNGGTIERPINKPFSLELSKARARFVALYLIDKGIESSRIKYQGYGPDRPIASNKTAEGRRKNQRVEIKILST